MRKLLLHDAYIEIICDVRKNEIMRIYPMSGFAHPYICMDDNGNPKTVMKKGRVLDILKDGNKVIVDMSVEYRSQIEEFDVLTFICTYCSDLFSDIRGPLVSEMLFGRVHIVDTGKWCVYDQSQDDFMFREGSIIYKDIEPGKSRYGRIYDIEFTKLDKLNGVLSYKMDCSTQGCSEVYSYDNSMTATLDKYNLWNLNIVTFGVEKSPEG